MAQVYAELYRVLRPGGVAAVVVKDFVRNRQRVPLCDRTAQLLEAVGFTVIERTHAMLVKDTPVGVDMFSGEHVTKRTERKSFFRRLSEKKAAEEKYWKTLARDQMALFLFESRRQAWDAYNDLSEDERQERIESDEDHEQGALKYLPPSRSKIVANARSIAFAESGESTNDWNTEVRIDYEVVLWAQKAIQEDTHP